MRGHEWAFIPKPHVSGVKNLPVTPQTTLRVQLHYCKATVPTLAASQSIKVQ